MLGRPANDGKTDGATEQHDDGTGEQHDRPPVPARTGAEADGRRAHPSRRNRSRRGFLGGMAGMGIGVGTATPGRVLEHVDDILSQADEEGLPSESAPHDPHTVATFEAIIDAVIPSTEGLTDKVGENLDPVHDLGGLDADMTGMCIDILNDFMSPELSVPKVANTGETAPLSEALATILDVAATELLARGGNEDQPQPGRFGSAGGPFASLSRSDRFRALYDVENRANQFGDGEAQFSKTVGIENGRYSRTGSFVVALAVVFPPIVYYSDMNAYDDFIDNAPSERTFDPAGNTSAPDGIDTLIGWAQTGYPGITEGHDALLGYEMDPDFEVTQYGDRGPNGRPGKGPLRGSGSPDDDDEPSSTGEAPPDDSDDGSSPIDGLLPEEWTVGGGF
jgi:hypothetical protein